MQEEYVSKSNLNGAIDLWIKIDKSIHPWTDQEKISISELRDLIRMLQPSDVVKNYKDRWRVYTEDEEGNPLSWICQNCGEVVETMWAYCPICGIEKENGSG